MGEGEWKRKKKDSHHMLDFMKAYGLGHGKVILYKFSYFDRAF